jgi:hypothetical protein
MSQRITAPISEPIATLSSAEVAMVSGGIKNDPGNTSSKLNQLATNIAAGHGLQTGEITVLNAQLSVLSGAWNFG